jgi:hypothetical protein
MGKNIKIKTKLSDKKLLKVVTNIKIKIKNNAKKKECCLKKGA